jgi:hypothetical protein
MPDTPRDDQNTPTPDSEHLRHGAADRPHGTHGKGESREILHDTPNSAAADGSTVERRSEPRGKPKKKMKW